MRTILVLLTLLLTYIGAYASDLCLDRYGSDIKRYSEWYFGIDYPYWYTIGLIKNESRCVWRRSLDGLGSVGVGQITPRFWDTELRKEGLQFYAQEGHEHHAGAIVYILKKVYDSTTSICSLPCSLCHQTKYPATKKLWIVYQGYNRNIAKLNREVSTLPSCDWSLWEKVCKEVDVCVWRNKDGSCRQWRNGCDINAHYGLNVYTFGEYYKRLLGVDSSTFFAFW
jgi:hypothetical protein